MKTLTGLAKPLLQTTTLVLNGAFLMPRPKGPAQEPRPLQSFSVPKPLPKPKLASASASAGPVKATVGLSADTGGEIGLTQVEAKVLGTGFSFGRKMGVSLFGTGVEFKLW